MEITELEYMALKHPARKYSRRLMPVEPIEGEIWLPIPKTNEQYYVSNLGRVKKEWLLKSGQFVSGIMLPQQINGKLFVGLTLRNNYQVKTYVHKLVLMAFAPMEGQEKKFVKFKDGNYLNCKLENLEWSSRYSASQYMIDNGYKARRLKTKAYLNKVGKIRYRPVQFSEKDYESIREMYAAGVSQLKIAELFKSSQGYISQVVNHKVK